MVCSCVVPSKRVLLQIIFCSCAIGHVRYINIQAWLRGFQVKIANFSSFFCPPIPKRDLDTKKTTPNIEVWPESLGAMLEYWYIERGLLEPHFREKNGRSLPWAARKWLKYENNLGNRMIKQLLNSVITKYHDLPVSRRSRVRTLFQKQISRTFPGLFKDSDWFFKGSKNHINPYTPKISVLILLTIFHTLHIF